MSAARKDEKLALELARALIRCPSVTPRDEGALDVLESALKGLGFVCHRLPFAATGTAEIDNLYARYGTRQPNFCFAGHTDVVPSGSPSWTVDPFAAEVVGGRLYGRGAADMKGAIASFVAACARLIREQGGRLPGSVSLLVTGDEEGPAVNGTAKVLDWLARRGEKLDACLVGEPTSVAKLGDSVKIGRRGSLAARLTVHGVQGHTAYPRLADNPIPKLLEMLARIAASPLDEGNARFEPSNLEITTIDVGNPAANVIPAEARATLNIRFNDLHTGESLTRRLRAQCDAVCREMGGSCDLAVEVSGEAFLGAPGALADLVCEVVAARTGIRPERSTAGGTSDARFIHRVCPVVELGLPGRTMHKVDECVEIADLEALADIYHEILVRYFGAAAPGAS